MKTTKPQAEAILQQLQAVAEARIRPMMGEYVVYVNDKVVGQINHGLLFIKITPFGEGFAAGLKREAPYDGAKPMFIVPPEKVKDAVWLRQFLAETVAEL